MGKKPILLIVTSIAVVTSLCAVFGFFLETEGKDGSILFTNVAMGLGGLIALLSSTRDQPTTTPSGATKVEVQNTTLNPVKTDQV